MKATTPERTQLRLEEELLWELLRKGDARVIAYIVERYSSGMINNGLRLTNDIELVKDALQDTFHHLIKKPPASFKPPKSLRAYLNGALKNKLLEILKRRGREFPESILDTDDLSFLETLAEEATSKARRELVLRIKQAILALPRKQRKAVLLRHYFNCTFKEVAAKMAMKEDASKKLVYRAYPLLKEAFNRNP